MSGTLGSERGEQEGESFRAAEGGSDSKPRWATIVALVISVVSLFGSSATFYRQFIYEKHELRAAILNIETTPIADTGNPGSRLEANVAVANVGNRTEILFKTSVALIKENGGASEIAPVGPFVIQPQEVRIVKIASALPSANELSAEFPNRKIHLGISFLVVDTDAPSSDSKLYFEKMIGFSLFTFDEQWRLVGAAPLPADTGGFVKINDGPHVE